MAQMVKEETKRGMLHMRKENEEVFYGDDKVIQVKASDINWLINQAEGNLRKRARLCTHRNTEELLHEMFIVLARDTYIKPHKHLGKPESFHVLEGLVDVVLFDENGDVLEMMRMGNYESGMAFYYRILDPLYHTLLIRSNVLVFHETTTGPFNPTDTVFAPWSPEADDKNACKAFESELLKKLISLNDVREVA
jgi:cupin fold WbuC family metalloprotein